MSDEMASKIEIEATAERLIAGADYWESVDYRENETGELEKDMESAGKWILSRLAADRDDREERARPIDAEWLESIGATWFGDYLGFDLPNSARLEVMRDYGAMTVECGLRPKHIGGWVQINPLRNRGEVLDLLRVLKGGAE